MSSMVSSSSGEVVRGSTTVQSIPAAASFAAASSATFTMRPSATIVASPPSRTMRASPNGTV